MKRGFGDITMVKGRERPKRKVLSFPSFFRISNMASGSERGLD